MAKKKSKSVRQENIELFARFIELNVQMGRNITPYLFIPYSRLDWEKVKALFKKTQKEYNSSLFD